jgi:hypothetical protein
LPGPLQWLDIIECDNGSGEWLNALHSGPRERSDSIDGRSERHVHSLCYVRGGPGEWLCRLLRPALGGAAPARDIDSQNGGPLSVVQLLHGISTP